MNLSSSLIKLANALQWEALFNCIADIPEDILAEEGNFYQSHTFNTNTVERQVLAMTLRLKFYASRIEFTLFHAPTHHPRTHNTQREGMPLWYCKMLLGIARTCENIYSAIRQTNYDALRKAFDSFILFVQALPNIDNTFITHIPLENGNLGNIPVFQLHSELKRIATCYQVWERENGAEEDPIIETLFSLGYGVGGSGEEGQKRLTSTKKYFPDIKIFDKGLKGILFFYDSPSPFFWNKKVTIDIVPQLEAAVQFCTKNNTLLAEEIHEGIKRILGDSLYQMLNIGNSIGTREGHETWGIMTELRIWINRLKVGQKIRNLLNALTLKLAKAGYKFEYSELQSSKIQYHRTEFRIPYKIEKTNEIS